MNLEVSASSSALVVLGLYGACCANGPGAPKPAPPSFAPPDYSVAACEMLMTDEERDPCIPGKCLPNSPDVNVFPINGMDASGAGACNKEGVQLVPRSLHGGGCPDGADLMLSDDKKHLVGKFGNSIVCEDQQLTGASFVVRGPIVEKGAKGGTVELTIRGVRDIPGHETRQGYRIDAGNGSLCSPEASSELRRGLGTKTVDFHELVRDPDYSDDLAIVVTGAVYDYDNVVMTMKDGVWFNLACAADSLAKIAMNDLWDPNDDDRSRAALNMFAARYCGRTAYTYKGLMFDYEYKDIRPSVESDWAPDRAMCITEPRLMQLGAPRNLPDHLQPKNCKRGPGESLGKCDKAAWIAELKKDCGIEACKGEKPADAEFRSISYTKFVTPGGAKEPKWAVEKSTR